MIFDFTSSRSLKKIQDFRSKLISQHDHLADLKSYFDGQNLHQDALDEGSLGHYIELPDEPQIFWLPMIHDKPFFCGTAPVHPRKITDLRKTVKAIEVEWLPQTS